MERKESPYFDKSNILISSHGLSEADVIIDEGNGEDGKPKREVTLTLIKEGHGNPKDKRYYTRECVEGLDPLIYTRKKLFIDHLGEGAAPASDKLKNWAATLMRTWCVESDEGLVRKGKLKIHDNWLWERCLDPIARKELAVSIEGRGAGRPDSKDGKDVVLIEKIHWLNAFKFVPYPGNATMGAETVEGAQQPPDQNTQEEDPMDLKGLSLELLEAERPDLFKALSEKAKSDVVKVAAPSADAMKSLREEMMGLLSTKTASLNATIESLNTKLQDTEKKLDAAEIRERMASKKTIIDSALKEAALPAEVLTPRFIARLNALSEREVVDDKGAKRIWSVAEQVAEEIKDMKTLLQQPLGSTTAASGSTVTEVQRTIAAAGGADLAEDEKQFLFNKHFLGLHEDIKDVAAYRVKRDKKTEPVAAAK